MIKTAEDAYLAGRQAAMQKLAMSRDDKMGYGVNAGIGAAGFGTMGHAADGLDADFAKHRYNRVRPYSGRFGRLGGFLKRNRYALGLGALGAAIGAASYKKDPK
jgi:hypothetical protein